MPEQQRRNHILAQSAVVVALSLVLGNLRLLELPAGGSVSFGALPLLAFAAVHGVRRSWAPCTVAGLLAHALAGGTIVHPAQLLLDYGVAYGALALAGLGAGRARVAGLLALTIAELAQLACFVASGTIFFAQGASAVAAAWFALGYNVVTVLPELALALWLVPTLAAAIRRAQPRATVPPGRRAPVPPPPRRDVPAALCDVATPSPVRGAPPPRVAPPAPRTPAPAAARLDGRAAPFAPLRLLS